MRDRIGRTRLPKVEQVPRNWRALEELSQSAAHITAAPLSRKWPARSHFRPTAARQKEESSTQAVHTAAHRQANTIGLPMSYGYCQKPGVSFFAAFVFHGSPRTLAFRPNWFQSTHPKHKRLQQTPMLLISVRDVTIALKTTQTP